MDKSISRAEELARIGKENELAELEYEDSEVKIHLTFEAPHPPQQSFTPDMLANLSASYPAAPQVHATTTEPSQNTTSPSKPSGKTINSPLAGVFYRAPGPDADPFISESEQVAAGQTLCIVEAMKLMNEIAAEKPCKIVKILVENSEAVEEGQALFQIE